MRTLMTPQQGSFFTQNGYIELGGLPLDLDAIFTAAKTASDTQPLGRDLWRSSPFLRQLVTRKLSPTISHLIPQPVRLACDQWMPSHPIDRASSVKELFCIQGLVLSALLVSSAIKPPLRRLAALGIPPFPSDPSHVLFVRPHIVLDWPLLSRSCPAIYLIAYAFSGHGVYTYNPRDPATHSLKAFGYEFGDILAESHHPVLTH